MRLHWTPRARADIADIFDWIARDNPPAAALVIACIRERAELLAEYPKIGRETNVADLHVLPVVRYPYLVYHRIADEEIVIVHIRHSARDTPKPGEIGS